MNTARRVRRLESATERTRSGMNGAMLGVKPRPPVEPVIGVVLGPKVDAFLGLSAGPEAGGIVGPKPCPFVRALEPLCGLYGPDVGGLFGPIARSRSVSCSL